MGPWKRMMTYVHGLCLGMDGGFATEHETHGEHTDQKPTQVLEELY